MTIGTLYTYPNNVRAHKAYIAAKYNGETIDEKIVELRTESYNKLAAGSFGKVPFFETVDGKKIFESNAIAYYAAAFKPNSPLLGRDAYESALIEQWLAFSDNEVLTPCSAPIYIVLGFQPYNDAVVKNSQEKITRTFSFIDSFLLDKTFLIGDRITLADITLACSLAMAYRFFVGDAERKQYKNLHRYVMTLMKQENFQAFFPSFEAELKPTAFDIKKAANEKKAEKAKAEGGKSEKPKAEKVKAEKPKAEKEEAEPDYSDPKPKEKNPLDLLPPSPFVLDEWKRTYSNNDTRPVAVDWFWKHFDTAGYSLYKVSYKYNDELTLTFMSSNLIGGFYQRLERARKYAFGSMLVLGEDNKNFIQGYFVFRGDGVPFEVTDAADYESYDFKKVDSSDPAVREEFNAYIAWDETVEGLKMCDGKVFK